MMMMMTPMIVNDACNDHQNYEYAQVSDVPLGHTEK